MSTRYRATFATWILPVPGTAQTQSIPGNYEVEAFECGKGHTEVWKARLTQTGQQIGPHFAKREACQDAARAQFKTVVQDWKKQP